MTFMFQPPPLRSSEACWQAADDDGLGIFQDRRDQVSRRWDIVDQALHVMVLPSAQSANAHPSHAEWLVGHRAAAFDPPARNGAGRLHQRRQQAAPPALETALAHSAQPTHRMPP
jgi:hypothetical protein